MCQSVYYADKGKNPQPTPTVVTDFKMCNSAYILPKMKTAPTTYTLFLNDIRMTFVNWTSSVQFSRSVMSDSLRPHESQHARPPCPSPSPGVHSNSCPSSQWCHPAISSSIVPFSSCPQFLPASESFPMSQLFTWGGQRIGVSASASVLVKKSQGWSSEWTGWILLQHHSSKASILQRSTSSQSSSHIYTWLLEKP